MSAKIKAVNCPCEPPKASNQSIGPRTKKVNSYRRDSFSSSGMERNSGTPIQLVPGATQ